MMYWFDFYPPVVDRARLADVDDLSDIHAASFHRGWSAPEIEALLSQDSVLCFVARRGSPFGTRRPVGFVMLRTAADEAEVLTVAVSPRHRGRGIARTLMEEAFRRLYHDRVGKVFLEVDDTNGAALALYAKLRFKQVGRRENYYAMPGGPAGTALVMQADLS